MHADRSALTPDTLGRTRVVSHTPNARDDAPDAIGQTPGVPARTSITAHLGRGVIGFGLLGSAFALLPSVGPAALLLAAPGMVALRGCPTCWIAGLLQAISAGRLQRTCNETGCTLHSATAPPPRQPPGL